MSEAMFPISAVPAFQTLADVQAHLGGIPIHRIRLRPVPGEATEADLLSLYKSEGRICELVDGILVEKDMATYEALLAGVLLHFIHIYLDENDIGLAFPGDGLLRLFEGRVRAPDVSFVSYKRMPNQELPDEAIASLTPDLAVEVLSEGNTAKEIDDKIKDYFTTGCKLVWIIDPPSRTAKVYTGVGKFVSLDENDSLDGRKVLPGFSLPIKKLFARASRKRRK